MPKNLVDLKWQAQMGADEVLSDAPVNRFKESELKKAKTQKPKTVDVQNNENAVQANKVAEAGSSNISNPAVAMKNTKQIAQKCEDLAALKAAVMQFEDLSIAKTATKTVFADGNPESEIMLIGEAPGAEEDAQGIPFCGASGKLLDQMFECIGLTRQKNFYITNTIFWRPPGNRRPTPEELAICLPFVEKHVALIKPKLIVLVGGTAITSLLNSKQGITTMRGNFFQYSNEYLASPIQTTAIFHPSYLLRSPGQKRIAWKDLLMLKQHIKENGIKI